MDLNKILRTVYDYNFYFRFATGTTEEEALDCIVASKGWTDEQLIGKLRDDTERELKKQVRKIKKQLGDMDRFQNNLSKQLRTFKNVIHEND